MLRQLTGLERMAIEGGNTVTEQTPKMSSPAAIPGMRRDATPTCYWKKWPKNLGGRKNRVPGPEKKRAVCLAGEKACPPEDCGGIWGYYELLEALNNPKHESHQEMLDWLGEPFDPDRFDLQEVNAILRGLKL